MRSFRASNMGMNLAAFRGGVCRAGPSLSNAGHSRAPAPFRPAALLAVPATR